MIDITSAKSFERVQYWLEEIAKVRSSPHPFMLVGSHSNNTILYCISKMAPLSKFFFFPL